MSTLSVQVTGFDDFMKDVAQAGVDAGPLVNTALFNSALHVQNNVRERAPHQTGALQGNVLLQVDYPTAQITVESPYGIFVEEGTQPHEIRPINKKALYWSGAFNPVKAVMHPGTKAQPFFQPGVDASVAYIDETFTKIMEKLITVMAGHTA